MTSSPPTQSLSSTLAAISDTSAETRARRALRRAGFVIPVVGLVVLVDQWTKALVRASLEYGETWPAGWELIRLTHLANTGSAFGMLQGASDALTVVTLVAVAGITYVLLALPARRFHALAMSAILGGAVGNLIDRLRLGAVTDFIDPTHYPAFNIADSAIVVGVFTLLALTWSRGDSPSEPLRDTSPGVAPDAPGAAP